MKTFSFEVITPERTVLHQEVRSVSVPAEGGSMGFLANHAPLITTLATGVVHVVAADGAESELMVSGGFLEVKDNHVQVLADVGERAEEIDLDRAERAEKRARERLTTRGSSDLDLARAEASLHRALARAKIVRDLRGRRGR